MAGIGGMSWGRGALPGVNKGIPGAGIIGVQPRPNKGISGQGIIQTQARPPGSTPYNMPPAQPPQSAPAQATGNSATTQGADNLDSTYYGNVAAHNFQVGNQINALNLRGANDQTALQTALAQLAYQQPRDQLALEQKANQGGGLYSSVYGQNAGNLVHSYATRQAEAQNNFASQAAQIASEIAALQGGVPLYNDQQAAAATGRAALAAQNNPALGQGTGGVNTNPGANAGGAGPGGSLAPQAPGTLLTGTATYRAPKPQTLAQAIAGRQTVNVQPRLGIAGGALPRQTVRVPARLGLGGGALPRRR